MLPYFSGIFGNPSSIHRFGQQAEAALEEARRQVAADLQAQMDEVVFTACGTESDNLALRGAAFARRKHSGARHLLISPVEHHAVSHTAEQLAHEFGFELELLPVDEFGQVQPADVARRLRPDTALVSVVYANNEIGTINPIAEIGAICRQAGVPFHSDAVQAAAHLKMDMRSSAVDLLAIGAHKFYGPKGIGALYVRTGTELLAVETGGKQEAGLRAGTQNVPYIVGLAEAFHLAQTGPEERARHYLPLRDALIVRVLETVPDARLTGHPTQRLPNHASFVFEGADGNRLLMLLDLAGFACSSGSACKVGNPSPSDVLLALGLSPRWALGSLRVTLGKDSTPEQVEQFLGVLPRLVEKARA
jgi:cysteine desulfurase